MNSLVDNGINIILGDFNIDGYKENTNLKELFEQYTMVVSNPTHLSGSLLDYVYIKKTFIDILTHMQCIVKGILFSDHAVKLQLMF